MSQNRTFPELFLKKKYLKASKIWNPTSFMLFSIFNKGRHYGIEIDMLAASQGGNFIPKWPKQEGKEDWKCQVDPS